MSPTGYGWLVLAFPLVGATVIGLLFNVLRERPKVAGAIGTLAIAASFVAGVLMVIALEDRPEDARQVLDVGWSYAVIDGLDAEVSILVDPLSCLMVLVVSGVSALIHLYSTAYMVSDRGYVRFFAYLNFFVFSMLLLVLAGNFVLLIVGWAFVGAASYFLISFWYRRTTATAAGIKAFVINVIGDVGLTLGTFFILQGTGTVDFLGSFEAVEAGEAFAQTNDGNLVAGLLLILVGAFAKSAQVPFHTWLPDAMEGPTPVSALIHAATMVTAGVYLIARLHPLFEQAPTAADVAVVLGAFTLLMAATIGLVVTDVKRVIAYSTMSQIGYMVVGVSAGVYVAGMFHLMTHAFFKALLFMAAGSLIGAMAGNQDLDRMRGFRKAMPFTFAMFVIGGLALAGVPPFSGFFSKDEILTGLLARGGGYAVVGVVGYVVALMTAIYTFRLIFRAFLGEPSPEAKELEAGHLHHAPEHTNPANGEVEDTDTGFPGPDHHVAEQSGAMKVAMGVLALLAVGAGALQVPEVTDVVEHFLEPTFEDSTLLEATHPSQATEFIGLAIGAACGIVGIATAYLLWVRKPAAPAAIRARLKPVHAFLAKRWMFDELYDAVIVRPVSLFGRFAQSTFERLVVQGLLVGGAKGSAQAGSGVVRALQSGFLRAYAALLVVGLVGLGLYFLLAAA